MNKKAKHIKPNKKGSSLFMVMITLAIVSIFAAIALLMSFGGYIAKHKDTRSDKNFYTLEERLDQIYMYIGIKANEIFVDKYMELRNKLPELAPGEIDSTYLKDCQDAFEDENNIFAKLKDDDFRKTDACPTEVKDGNGFTITFGDISFKEEKDSGEKRAFVFKDVCVKYKSGIAQSQPPAGEVDTFNSITTDIVITIPKINITAELDLNAKHEYIYISDGDISLKGTHDATGNIYCGNSMIIGNNRTDKVSVKANYLTVFNTLTVKNGSLDLFGRTKKSEIWARDIKTDKESVGSVLTVIGNVYTADDLEINGNYSTVSLFGTYTGFGRNDGQSGDHDSAIAVNGQGTTLDLSGVTKIIIGGNAYFPLDYSSSNPVSDPSYYKTGDALALLVNENLHQVYSGYVHTADKYVDNIKDNTTIGFDEIKDSKDVSLQQYIDDGYTLISTGVDIKSSEPAGLGLTGESFYNTYIDYPAWDSEKQYEEGDCVSYNKKAYKSLIKENKAQAPSSTSGKWIEIDTNFPIKLATHEEKGYKYCYLYWDFANDNKEQEFISLCIKKGFAEEYLSNFLDLGQVIVSEGSEIYAETDLYAYIPGNDTYKAVLAKAKADKTILPTAVENEIGECKTQFEQYNKSLAPTDDITEHTLAAAGNANAIIYHYLDPAKINETDSTTFIYDENGEYKGKLLIIDGDLRISDGNVIVTVTGSPTSVKSGDTEVAVDAISKMNGYGMIITKGSFISDSSVMKKFGGMIISYNGINITGGSYVYDGKSIVDAINITKSPSYENSWDGLFTDKFFNDTSYGSMGKTSFKITDFLKYENWMKNKNA